jgi:TctA family transporter
MVSAGRFPRCRSPPSGHWAAALTALRVLGMEVGPTVFDPSAKLVFGLAER